MRDWMRGKRVAPWVVAVAALGLVVSVAAVGLAAPPRGRAAGPGAWGAAGSMPPVWQALGLTEQQISQIQEIQTKAYQEAAPIQQQLLAKRQELALVLRQAQPDQAKAKSLLQEIGQLQQKLAEQRLQTQLAIRAVLTDEQKAKITTFGPYGGGLGMGPCGGGLGRGYRGGGMGRMMGPGWGW
ncbi:MAG: periplasmic heavy metal sensor [Limnochordaceae bacterium]|nr:periplasmic heavy metal sensor [Limnochordaceae bacterium]